jgi:hypothetical protein
VLRPLLLLLLLLLLVVGRVAGALLQGPHVGYQVLGLLLSLLLLLLSLLLLGLLQVASAPPA